MNILLKPSPEIASRVHTPKTDKSPPGKGRNAVFPLGSTHTPLPPTCLPLNISLHLAKNDTFLPEANEINLITHLNSVDKKGHMLIS